MPPSRRIAKIPLFATVLVTGIVTTLGLAACGANGSSSGTSAAGAQEGGSAGDVAGASASAAAAPAAEPQRAGGGAVAQGKTATSGGGAALPAPDIKLIKTADVVIEVTVLKTAAAQVRSMAEGVGGTVASETTSYSGKAPVSAQDGTGTGTATPAPGRAATVLPGESVLVLRVPVAAMDQTVDRVASVGKELSRTSSSLDVTADLADLGSRVKTQQSSVSRVRELLARASSLQDIVLLESELSRREADLEALQARQGSLAGRAQASTLTVTLRTPDVTPPNAVTPDDNSFVGGLKQGWHAVVVSTGVVLTVLGALLPLLVVLVVLGLPVWWFRRRRPAARRAPAPSPAPSPSQFPAMFPAPHQAPAPHPAPSPAPAPARPTASGPTDPGPTAPGPTAPRPTDPGPTDPGA